ncbi:MAG: NAD-glutamate dehydrogenase [Geminicoccaceae bacterium]|nr:MAG: NAD-glutamate dehydrogenase [Geminicoccaceae bacterium]
METELAARTAALFEDLALRLRERLEPAEAAKAERFVRLYYTGAAASDLLLDDPLDLYGSALDHYRLAFERQPGEVKLRVYNPDLERDGWQSTHSVVTVVTDDGPFLVDSLTAAMGREGLALHFLVHPILHVRRDAAGRLVDCEAEATAPAESFIRLEVDQLTTAEALDRLKSRLADVLGDVRLAVEDWRAMVGRIDDAIADVAPGLRAIEESEAQEVTAFLRWLADNHFTFLGYGRYALARGEDGLQLEREPASTLGILKSRAPTPSTTFAQLPREVRDRAADPLKPLILTKANSRSTVHRTAHLDYVGVKRFADDGSVIGEHRFLGLFTSAAYNRSVSDIPLLRGKAKRLLRATGVRPASHDGRAMLHIIETYPRDELFQADEAYLAHTLKEILHLQDRQRLRLFLRHDPFGRFATCLVFVPRERYHTGVRERFEAALTEALGGDDVQFETRIGDHALARVLFTIRTPPGQPIQPVDVAALEAELTELARTWGDRLCSALIEAVGEGEGNRLVQRYGEGIPAGYQESLPPRLAVPDLLHLDRLAKGKVRLAMSLYRPIEPGSELLRFKLLRADEKIALATVLPVLAHMGLTVIDEQPYQIRDVAGRNFWLHDFGMCVTKGSALDLDQIRERFQDAFACIWHGEVEDDGFNRLVLLAGLDIRQVQYLRVYCRYLQQIKIPFSQAYIEDTLSHHPLIARTLAELFETRFDPAFEGDRAAAVDTLASRIGDQLEQVEVRDEDIIVRAYREVMLATLRTNAFQRSADGKVKGYVAIKLDPGRIRLMPEPRPAFEIFVHSVRFEGVHLRGGKVARGGLRWSDRREDFRTEVLSLMKAQQIKNSIIVPVGAKGGFVLKRPPKGGRNGDERQALQDEAIACYRLFLSGLLDVTDNRQAGAIVPPPDVVRYDDDDPYLVVAADKGTATFSDIANDVAKAYGFWLGDAFASGGSAGYDHKKMGITAKGAWESVKRHFKELGRNCQKQPFTCVGIGDMSGDVFGNGMLLSAQTKLIAAFDHRHVFIDPDPDPATSFAERQRLFLLPRSSWDDYDRTKLSRGGGIYPRTAKTIQLSPDAKRALGVTDTVLAPIELIKAILQAPVDLLWNGGIGTYVKASFEVHAEAEDRTNDALRVDADRLRCRIIGEGGNLGMTQAARIEFAQAGGRVNTDSIDNSAGVDCSDHEVNIKILLGDVVAAGDLTLKQRDELLAAMTDEVADLCLRDNILQNFVLSIAQSMPADYLDAQIGLMHRLEAAGVLDRPLALLPNDDGLAERRKAGKGLTRPEMAVLLAHTKNALYAEILETAVVDEPYLDAELQRYFPEPLQARFADAIRAHGLRREIVATWLANSLVNRGLDVFANELAETTGRDVPDIARAYVIARDAFRLLPLWAAIENLENVAATEQIAFLAQARQTTLDGTAWFLAHLDRTVPVQAAVERFRAGIDRVVEALPHTLPVDAAERLAAASEGYAAAGLEADLAARLAGLPYLMAACDIIEVAVEVDSSVEATARTYFALDAALDLARPRRWLAAVAIRSRWDRLTAAGLTDDLYRELRRITAAVLTGPDEGAPSDQVEAWLARTDAARRRADRLAAEVDTAPALDLSMIAVAVRSLRELGTR